jgi:DNA-binding LacI/PurR family transcriptional regulator
MDGALVYSCGSDVEALDWLVRRGLPLVYVDQDPVPGVPSVNVDDRAGARAAAQHVVDLGHRRVGILTGELAGPHGVPVPADAPSEHHAARQRMLGWTDALGPAGVEPVVLRVPLAPQEQAYDAARTLLEMPHRPTAVLCFSDVLAFWALRAAQDLGLAVPGDVSLVGFDDNPLACRIRPALTTVRQDVSAKGHAAAAALTDAIARARDGRKPHVRHLTLPTELVVRESTAAPSPGR